MKNDIIVKATWIVNFDGNSKVYFDYFNREGNFVGNVIITEKGKMSWAIINANYKDNIINVVNYIMGINENRRLQDETADENDVRWYNMRMYIYTHGIILNKRQGEEERIKK